MHTETWPQPISRANLRTLLTELLKTDSELDAFLTDYFPQVQTRLSNSHDRMTKISTLFQHTEEQVIFKSLTDRFPSQLSAAAKEQQRYDELASLRQDLSSYDFGEITLLDLVRAAAGVCFRDVHADPSPLQIMQAILEILKSNEHTDRAYWWLVVCGVFRFKDIEKWWTDSSRNPVWDKSVSCVIMANRGRHLLKQLATEGATSAQVARDR